jgi:hypothetical protein
MDLTQPPLQWAQRNIPAFGKAAKSSSAVTSIWCEVKKAGAIPPRLQCSSLHNPQLITDSDRYQNFLASSYLLQTDGLVVPSHIFYIQYVLL